MVGAPATRTEDALSAAVRIRAAASGPPAQPASAARSVLRRWANAASTTAKTASRSTSAGGCRAVNATSPESTFGTGQKTPGGTRPADRACAYHASLTVGIP